MPSERLLQRSLHPDVDLDPARAHLVAVGRSTLTQRHVARPSAVQRAADHARLDAAWAGHTVQLARDGHSGLDDDGIQAAAAHGLGAPASALPHLDAIQRAFGHHDVSGVTAHVGGAAREASEAMGAHAYATGNHVAFAEAPSLALVAHEAAHVVQQRAGVQLSSAVGQVGDAYEQQADAVAERVVRGESAVDLLPGGGDHAAADGGVQRKPAAPTAGPSEDDRFGAGPVAADAHGRIIQVSVSHAGTRITVGLGAKQGVHVGMEGYVASADGMLADFQIEDVADRVCHATIQVPPDALAGHDQVVVNPGTMPKAAVRHDMKARIVGISVDHDRTRIMIGFGSNHGARAGMRGYLVGDDGRRYTSFEIAEEHPGHSVAYVDDTVDAVRAHSNVVLNPS